MFKVGDKVVGNENGYFHRIGQNGTIESLDEGEILVKWADGDMHKAKSRHAIDLVSSAPQPEPTPPRKMHPDDFMLAVCEFATDNGFGVTQLDFHGKEFIGAALPRHYYSV